MRMVSEILDWRGRVVRAVRSRGGKTAVCDLDDNLLKPVGAHWPTPEIVQKMYGSDRLDAFESDDQSVVTERLGYYCDLQSLNSEDAMTWSYFGPLIYANGDVQRHFADWLLGRVGIEERGSRSCQLWLWRTVPHPDKPQSTSGPEIDFGIVTDTAVVFGEAKWRSNVGKNQGVGRDKNQIQLRRECFEKFGRAIYPWAKNFVVMGVGLSATVCGPWDCTDSGVRRVGCNLSWSDLCQFSEHPMAEEISAYYQWKAGFGGRGSHQIARPEDGVSRDIYVRPTLELVD
jgi:hypothetical protein